MRSSNNFLGLIIALLIPFFCFGYGESYENLDDIDSLSLPSNYYQTSSPGFDYSIFDDVRLHGSIGFISSYQEYNVMPFKREKGGVKGIELSFGIDLFSENWIAEGILMNLPEAPVNDSKVSSSGFGLRLVYETKLTTHITGRLGGGIANRAYTIKFPSPDEAKYPSERTFSSGASVVAAGIDYWPNNSFSTGLELSSHFPMSSGDEPSSVDFGVKASGHF